MPTNTPSPTTAVLTMPAAFERLKGRIEMVPEEMLINVNLDVMAAVVTARGAARKVSALLPDITRMLPSFDATLITELDDVALAAAYASSRHTLSLAPSEELAEMAAKGGRMRDVLTTDAQSCIKRGLMDASSLKGLVSTTGYRAIAHDVMLLSGLLREAKTTLGARISATEAELDEADVLCAMLTDQVAMRENAPIVVAEAAKTRQRAFTLLVRTYDVIRRAVTFVRWHEDDADLFAPSLYAGRGGRKRKEPATDVAAVAKVTEEPVDAVADTAPSFTGMPGGSPLS